MLNLLQPLQRFLSTCPTAALKTLLPPEVLDHLAPGLPEEQIAGELSVLQEGIWRGLGGGHGKIVLEKGISGFYIEY